MFSLTLEISIYFAFDLSHQECMASCKVFVFLHEALNLLFKRPTQNPCSYTILYDPLWKQAPHAYAMPWHANAVCLE